MRILHVISDLVLGGATRSLLAVASRLARAGVEQKALSLGPVEPAVRDRMTALAIPVLSDRANRSGAVLGEADVVLIHFWHSARMQQFLRREWPPVRIVAWIKILGDTVPQIVTSDFVRFVDRVFVTSPATTVLPALQPLSTPPSHVPSIGDFDRVGERLGEPHGPIRVGYLGLVGFEKLHPDFVAMSTAVARPIVVPVWGDGDDYPRLKVKAAAAGFADRFRWNGPTERIGDALADMHVFGYPLADWTYATSERALQEAMYARLPAVVFDRPGYCHLVRNGETALVVRDSRGYVEAVTRLVDDPDLRRRIGHAARAYVEREINPDRYYGNLESTLADLVARMQKRRRAWPGAAIEPGDGAGLFVDSLGAHAGPFCDSLRGATSQRRSAADKAIAQLPTAVRNPGAGGLFDYRRTFPDDPAIAFWCGLSEFHRGAYANALAHLLVARRRGFPADQAQPWIGAAHSEVRRSQPTLEGGKRDPLVLE
jgi:glycosyltransferase involved in cell wall biosynthesis